MTNIRRQNDLSLLPGMNCICAHSCQQQKFQRLSFIKSITMNIKDKSFSKMG